MTTLYAYSATLETDGPGRIPVHFEGLPGATWGATEDEALDRARDLLATSIEMILEDGESPPPAPPANGRPLVNASLDQPAKG